MRKLFLLLGLLAALAIPAFPQTQTVVTGTVTDPNGIPYANGTMKATIQPVPPGSPCVVIGGNCQPIQGTVGPISMNSSGFFSTNLWANSLIQPSGSQWSIQICISPGVALPLGTGPQCFSVTTTISGSSQDLSTALDAAAPSLANLPNTSFGATGNLAGIYLSPACDPTNKNCYFVNDDVHYVGDATTTISNATVTCPNSDCNFTGTDYLGRPIAKVGQIVFATTGNTAGSLICGQTTISAINGANSITLAANCTASQVGTVVLLWGDDDASNISAGYSVAAANCLPINLPAGNMFTSEPQFLGALSGVCSANSTLAFNGVAVFGNGIINTFIIPLPNFDISACNSGVDDNGCFGGNNISDFDNLTIWGGGNSRTNSGTSKDIFVVGDIMRAYNVDVQGWGSNESGWTCISMQGNQTILTQGDCIAAGATGIEVSSAAETPSLIQGTYIYQEPNVAMTIDSGAWVMTRTMFIKLDFTSVGHLGVNVGAGGKWTSWDDVCISGDEANCMTVNGSAYLYNGSFGPPLGGGAPEINNYALSTYGGTGSVYAQDSLFAGNSGGGALYLNAGSNFFDRGGNTFVNYGSGANTLNGNVFIQGSADGINQTTGNIALTSGWGTSTVTAVSGATSPETFTITLAGTPTLNPVVTVTFPTPYLVAPAGCSIQETGGTSATLFNWTTGTVMATTAAFTLQGTPTTGTIIATMRCN